MVHVASVWVPFTSESKEAVAHYPEIIRETKLALQECGRKMSVFINRRRREKDERKKRDYIETYMPAIAEALRDILALKDGQTRLIQSRLREVLEKTRKVKIADERILEPRGTERDGKGQKVPKGAKKAPKPAKKGPKSAGKATEKAAKGRKGTPRAGAKKAGSRGKSPPKR
jgi:hypothetical protein